MEDLVYTSIIAIFVVGVPITVAIITSTPIRFKLRVYSKQIEFAAEMDVSGERKDD